jgi:hypothetical protein
MRFVRCNPFTYMAMFSLLKKGLKGHGFRSDEGCGVQWLQQQRGTCGGGPSAGVSVGCQLQFPS